MDNRIIVRNELCSPDGKVVARSSGKLSLAAGQTETYSGELKVRRPELWDLDTPCLYTLNTTLIQSGKVIDQTSIRTGFRSLQFDANRGFALNGRWMKIKGVCLHHDAGVLGASVPKEVWRRRLLNLKLIGVNAVRTSHNPQAPMFYDLCDELGLLVLNEMFDEWEYPKRKWIEGWNIGTPGYEGSYDFFEKWGEKDLADFVRRDRNHLSVFAWVSVMRSIIPMIPIRIRYLTEERIPDLHKPSTVAIKRMPRMRCVWELLHSGWLRL